MRPNSKHGLNQTDIFKNVLSAIEMLSDPELVNLLLDKSVMEISRVHMEMVNSEKLIFGEMDLMVVSRVTTNVEME